MLKDKGYDIRKNHGHTTVLVHKYILVDAALAYHNSFKATFSVHHVDFSEHFIINHIILKLWSPFLPLTCLDEE